MKPAALKRATVLGLILCGAVAGILATQVWVVAALDPSASATAEISVTGTELSRGLLAFSLALLATGLALPLAKPVLRAILSVLAVLLAAGLATVSFGISADPLAALRGVLADSTGLTGGAENALVTGVTVSVFSYITAGFAILAGLLGLLGLMRGHTWTQRASRYETNAEAQPAPVRTADANPDRISDWDQLSQGLDPSEDEQL